MNRNNKINIFKRYFSDNIEKIFYLDLIILIGIIVGIISFNFLNETNKNEVFTYVSTFTSDIKHGLEYNLNYFFQSIINNYIFLFLVILSSLTIFAVLAIGIIYFLKGYILGFTISCIYATLGIYKGSLLNFIIVILSNLILIPAITILGSICINFNFKVVLNRVKGVSVLKEIFKLVIILFPIIILIIFNSFVEAIIVPVIINWCKGII